MSAHVPIPWLSCSETLCSAAYPGSEERDEGRTCILVNHSSTGARAQTEKGGLLCWDACGPWSISLA